MSNVNSKWLEQQRGRWIRVNGHLYVRPDAYRFAAPGTPEAKPPGWLDPSATRVRLKEAQEEEARQQAAAAQEEFEREVLALRHDFAKLKLEYELWRFDQKYSPSQPRVPAGSREGGRWIGSVTVPSQQTIETAPSRPTVLAQPGFGRLVAEIRVPGGRRCIYNFGPINIVAPGPTNFNCSPRVHWSGVVHGKLLNDN